MTLTPSHRVCTPNSSSEIGDDLTQQHSLVSFENRHIVDCPSSLVDDLYDNNYCVVLDEQIAHATLRRRHQYCILYEVAFKPDVPILSFMMPQQMLLTKGVSHSIRDARWEPSRNDQGELQTLEERQYENVNHAEYSPESLRPHNADAAVAWESAFLGSPWGARKQTSVPFSDGDGNNVSPWLGNTRSNPPVFYDPANDDVRTNGTYAPGYPLCRDGGANVGVGGMTSMLR